MSKCLCVQSHYCLEETIKILKRSNLWRFFPIGPESTTLLSHMSSFSPPSPTAMNLYFSPATTTLSLMSPHKRNGPPLIHTLEKLVRDCFIFFLKESCHFSWGSLFFPCHRCPCSQHGSEGDSARSKHFCSNWVQTKNFGVAQRKPMWAW